MPSSGDPRWAEWTKPLLDFLADDPRSWSDLRQWARRYGVNAGMLQQQLAWLSLRRLAGTVGGGRWRAIDSLAAQAEDDAVRAQHGDTIVDRAQARNYGEPAADGNFWRNLARGK